jgi:heat-inducible transcriptional repressor
VGGHYVGKLGVIGPTRMRYSEITSVIDYMTKNLDRSFELLEDGSAADGGRPGVANRSKDRRGDLDE